MSGGGDQIANIKKAGSMNLGVAGFERTKYFRARYNEVAEEGRATGGSFAAQQVREITDDEE
jgi:hypothetical protein